MGHENQRTDEDQPSKALPPTMGRIVIFTDPEGRKSPAIVNEVTPSGEILVCAFDSVLGPRNFVTSGEGDEKGQWAWPPRA